MANVKYSSEKELIESVKKSQTYKFFVDNKLNDKMKREARGWALLRDHRGQYTKEILDEIFDTVDLYQKNSRWFGSLLATPNRNLIFASGLEAIINWIEELLFSEKAPIESLNTCMKDMKIKGASKGLATLLLYLSSPEKYNVWVNSTQEGLFVLGRLDQLKGKNWGENYQQFNKAALAFRDEYSFKPQEIDWILTFVSSYVESEDSSFLIDEDVLKLTAIPLPEDEKDIDDIVGEPMELRVMRWTPTNEMGVVALFIEFRKELGFPLVEFIRSRFPDAAVFETSSKGYIRRYIEFEYKSSGYKSHLKSSRKCHYVVCWEHDWEDCPIPVVELKERIPEILQGAKCNS